MTLDRPAPPDKEEELDMQHRPLTLPAVVVVALGTLLGVAVAHADNGANDTVVPNNSRLNKTVVENVFTIQNQAGCSRWPATNYIKINPLACRIVRNCLRNHAIFGALR